ncbi:MAG TPA: four helix bundle protein [Paludibacter sp.]|nr:four helix bundle protein [Paludibacter sp.]
MKDNIIVDKTYSFAVRIVKLYKYLCSEHHEYNLSVQILNSGTSVGANTVEGNSGQTKKDFITKLSISLKEAKETKFWLRLLHDTEFINDKMFESLIHDCDEIIMILNKIIITSKKNLEAENKLKKEMRKKGKEGKNEN